MPELRFLAGPFLSPSTCFLEQSAQRRPPFGPVLLYAVTVKRLLQISQFPSWPGIGRCFSFIISFAKASSSSSGSPVRRALRRANSLLFFIFSMACCRLRFLVLSSGDSGSGSGSYSGSSLSSAVAASSSAAWRAASAARRS